MARREYAGGAVATKISGAITATSLTIPVVDGSTLPTGTTGPFAIDLDSGDLSTYEKVLVASRSGNTLTVASVANRGYDGTVASTHASGAALLHIVTSIDLDEPNDHINTTTRDDHTQYNTVARHAAISHTSAMLAAGAVDNPALAGSGLDISKFTVGTSSRPTTGNAATATTATTATSATSATTATTAATATSVAAGGVNNAAAAFTWTTWVPTITGWGVGNAVITARYAKIGKIVHVAFQMTTGTTTTYGVPLAVSLPVSAKVWIYLGMVGGATDVSVGSTRIPRLAVRIPDATTFTFDAATIPDVGASVPFAWATGDIVQAAFTYEAL